MGICLLLYIFSFTDEIVEKLGVLRISGSLDLNGLPLFFRCLFQYP